MTEAQRIAFIQEIAPLAQNAYNILGKVKPSVCIGMACVESGYGGSKLMYGHNAVFGQKVGTGKTATKYWGGKFFTSKTKEEYTIGVHTTITSAFRAYDDLQQCVLNFYELLNTPLYRRVQALADYRTQMQQIKQCGYMTSSTEVSSVLFCIRKYSLTQYDIENQPSPVVKPTLWYGEANDYVLAWQKYLNTCGYDLAENSRFDDTMLAAVKKYQKSRGLEPDGIIGPLTWATVGK